MLHIEFAEPEAVEAAVALNESEFKGRQLKVSAKRTNVHGYGGKGGKGKGKGGKGKGFGKGQGLRQGRLQGLSALFQAEAIRAARATAHTE